MLSYPYVGHLWNRRTDEIIEEGTINKGEKKIGR